MPRSLPWLVHGREATDVDGKSKSRNHRRSGTPSNDGSDTEPRRAISETPVKSDSLSMPAAFQLTEMVHEANST
jgi:hypothetical protein